MAVERLARADQRLAARSSDFDADPWVLNTPDGVIDLKTGDIRLAHRDDFVSKMTAVGPGRSCPVWREFLRRITDGNSELERFTARSIGYGLTGITREHVLFFDFGLGANGKTVKNETIAGLLGDYALPAPIEMFTASKLQRHTTDVAALQGTRFVTASETEAGCALAESRIKLLTGGDTISARRMRRDNVSFKPQFKLFLTGNHKPRLSSRNEAMARRIHLIPFKVTIPAHERDLKLAERLKEEWPGILSWAIDTCIEWQRIGLAPPNTVREATANYIEAEDSFGKWITIAIEVDPNAMAKTTDLFGSWCSFAQETREEVGTMKDFTEVMEARGFSKQHTREGNRWFGIRLREV
jgi:putative DNA primase/helicase